MEITGELPSFFSSIWKLKTENRLLFVVVFVVFGSSGGGTSNIRLKVIRKTYFLNKYKYLALQLLISPNVPAKFPVFIYFFVFFSTGKKFVLSVFFFSFFLFFGKRLLLNKKKTPNNENCNIFVVVAFFQFFFLIFHWFEIISNSVQQRRQQHLYIFFAIFNLLIANNFLFYK